MKKYLLLILFFTFSLKLFSQSQGDTWCFGDSSILHYLNGQMSSLAFSAMSSTESSASISDKNGTLLFYVGGNNQGSNYSRAWNSNHQIMQNGDSLFSHSSSTNGVIIIPFVNDSNKYYVFYKGNNINYFLLKAVVDMGLNGGLGAVIQKNDLVTNIIMSEKLAAVRHGNGRDWWLVAHRDTSSDYYIYLIDTLGIHNPLIQSIGSVYTYNIPSTYYGEIVFSPDGSKLVAVSYQIIDYFGFDRCTGVLYNYQNLAALNPTVYDRYYGASFSPENTVLYVSTDECNLYTPQGDAKLYQFDLTASNITQSKQTIYTLFNTDITFGQHQLAPDGKIYVSMVVPSFPNFNYDSTSIYLNTISNPGILGSGCNFTLHTLYLNGHRTFYGLPNIPNYNLGALVGSLCDTLAVGFQEHLQQQDFSIYPNPSKGLINFNGKLTNGKINIRDITGRIVVSKNITTMNNFASVKISELQDGVYFYSVYDGKELKKQDRLIILK